MTRRKLDQETDELMWAAAESRDPNDWAEFERRFPDLRAEFATRRAMVDVLRNSKPSTAQRVHSAFRPTPTSPTRVWRRAILIPASAVLLVALGFAAFQVTLRLKTQAKTSPSTTPPMTSVRQAHEPEGSTRAPMSLQPQQPDISKRGIGERPPDPPPVVATVRIKSGGITLFQALNEVSRQGKVAITLLPGVSDQSIQLGPDPTAILEMEAAAMLAAIERVAPIRIIDNGPEGFIVAPLDKVNDVSAGPSPPTQSRSDSLSPPGR